MKQQLLIYCIIALATITACKPTTQEHVETGTIDAPLQLKDVMGKDTVYEVFEGKMGERFNMTMELAIDPNSGVITGRYCPDGRSIDLQLKGQAYLEKDKIRFSINEFIGTQNVGSFAFEFNSDSHELNGIYKNNNSPNSHDVLLKPATLGYDAKKNGLSTVAQRWCGTFVSEFGSFTLDNCTKESLQVTAEVVGPSSHNGNLDNMTAHIIDMDKAEINFEKTLDGFPAVCKLSLQRTNDSTLVVREENCSYFHGFKISFDGIYTKE